MTSLLRQCLADLSSLPLDDKFDLQTAAFKEVQRTREKLSHILSTRAALSRQQTDLLVYKLELVDLAFESSSIEHVLEAAREVNSLVRAC